MLDAREEITYESTRSLSLPVPYRFIRFLVCQADSTFSDETFIFHY
jgi:hypothetical protein